MQSLLIRPDVIDAMTNPTKPAKTGVSEQEFKKRKQHQAEQRKHLSTIKTAEQKKNIQEERTAVKLLENQHLDERQTSSTIINDIKKQDTSLNERMSLRRKRVQKVNSNLEVQSNIKLSSSGESDKSAGEISFSKPRKLDQSLESKKLIAANKIRNKYQEQITELETGPRSEVLDIIIATMKQEMQEEISKKMKRIDKKRSDQLDNAFN